MPRSEGRIATRSISQQSPPLTALVSQLISQDGGLELSGVPGVAFLQVQQQIGELAASHVSLLTYLERYGGYRGQREGGLSMWILAHAMDAAGSNDFSATKEFLALGVMALEQSAFDAGDWSLAYVLAMVEDPPATMFSERMNSITAAGKQFSPLVPTLLASTNLSYIKELEARGASDTQSIDQAYKESGWQPKGADSRGRTQGNQRAQEAQGHSRCLKPFEEEVEPSATDHKFRWHRGDCNESPISVLHAFLLQDRSQGEVFREEKSFLRRVSQFPSLPLSVVSAIVLGALS